MTVGVPAETFPRERCVAITPRAAEALRKAGFEVMVESSAGVKAGFSDDQYITRGARLGSRIDVFREADVLVQVRALGVNRDAGRADLPLLRAGQVVIGFGEPLTSLKECADLAETGVSFLSMELMPRITRAQSMDALSSMATVSGYRIALMAAIHLPKMFPMLMTASGTVAAARVFVLGAGVAGLQAIATSRRLGAIVSAYDVRPAVREQVESVGAKFVALDVDASASEDKRGYATAMDETFYRRQRELLTQVLREQDVAITTAAVPGRKAPILITAEMVGVMPQGSVIVDMAAAHGGNCELTRAGETVVHQGVMILGPVDIPSMVPRDASLMYASNVTAFLKHVAPKGVLNLNPEDEIIRETLVTHGKQVVHPRVVEALGRMVSQ
jgi:NAD(P) transhydrogenase subunit alpha